MGTWTPKPPWVTEACLLSLWTWGPDIWLTRFTYQFVELVSSIELCTFYNLPTVLLRKIIPALCKLFSRMPINKSSLFQYLLQRFPSSDIGYVKKIFNVTVKFKFQPIHWYYHLGWVTFYTRHLHHKLPTAWSYVPCLMTLSARISSFIWPLTVINKAP